MIVNRVVAKDDRPYSDNSTYSFSVFRLLVNDYLELTSKLSMQTNVTLFLVFNRTRIPFVGVSL